MRYEWESCCESLELIVPEEGYLVSIENIEASTIGNVGVGAAPAARSVAASFGAVLSYLCDTATPVVEGEQFGIDDGNDHGAL